MAEKHDHVNSKAVYYRYAKHLEAEGKIDEAITFYTKSGNHGYELPRMLGNNLKLLKKHVAESTDPALRNWWAHYSETRGDLDGACEYYRQSKDVNSLVRVLCQIGKIQEATAVAEETSDGAACFFLGRQYEHSDQPESAIHWYTKAKCFGHAVRLAKEKDLHQDLVRLALLGTKDLIRNIALYFEERGVFDKAASLYYKGGQVSKAIELSLESKQYNLLEIISTEMSTTDDVEIMAQVAKMYIEQREFVKAISFLVKAKRYNEALKLIDAERIPLIEDLADQLTPPTEFSGFAEILVGIAELAEKQGAFAVASKKFTQAGDRLRALKSLLRSGDTEKVIFFATVSGSKQKEIYVVAANYLQTLDWRTKPDIFKAIVTFYSKAKSFDSLVRFYEYSAEVEISEYSEYQKASVALTEALKVCRKESVLSTRVPLLEKRMENIGRFLNAQSVAQDDVVAMKQICDELLSMPDIEESVRKGDIFSLVIEAMFHHGDQRGAAEVLKRMKSLLSAADTRFCKKMFSIAANS